MALDVDGHADGSSHDTPVAKTFGSSNARSSGHPIIFKVELRTLPLLCGTGGGNVSWPGPERRRYRL